MFLVSLKTEKVSKRFRRSHEINDSLTVLSDGCLCMSAFVFGAGFQADPIRALATVYYGSIW